MKCRMYLLETLYRLRTQMKIQLLIKILEKKAELKKVWLGSKKEATILRKNRVREKIWTSRTKKQWMPRSNWVTNSMVSLIRVLTVTKRLLWQFLYNFCQDAIRDLGLLV